MRTYRKPTTKIMVKCLVSYLIKFGTVLQMDSLQAIENSDI